MKTWIIKKRVNADDPIEALAKEQGVMPDSCQLEDSDDVGIIKGFAYSSCGGKKRPRK